MKCYLTREKCTAADPDIDDGDSCPIGEYKDSNRETENGLLFDNTCRYYGMARAKELQKIFKEDITTMAKKDFSQVNTGRVYDTIAAATAEPEQEATEVLQEQEAQPKRKERRTYSQQEAAEIMQTLKTSGRKGLKLPRINLAFAPDIYEYVQIMSRVRGENMTDFVNIALRQHMEEHRDLYDRAIEFRNSL